jgi:hypothetical protein
LSRASNAVAGDVVTYCANFVEWQVCLVRVRLMIVMNGDVVEVVVQSGGYEHDKAQRQQLSDEEDSAAVPLSAAGIGTE